ncbi:MAG: DNA-binding protein [Clostridia bacterium]|nr:DNA-binding protein [Clostridia bacterium]
MVKDLKYDELFEEYKSLLTEKQQEVFTLYYRLDLSLGEIKEIKNISRQGVLDTVNKVCKLLDEYENKLHLLYKKKQILSKLDKIDDKALKEELIKIL